MKMSQKILISIKKFCNISGVASLVTCPTQQLLRLRKNVKNRARSKITANQNMFDQVQTKI